jgi:hypothetical protein
MGELWMVMVCRTKSDQLSLAVSLARTSSILCKNLFSWSRNSSPLMQHNVLFKRFHHYILFYYNLIPRNSDPLSLKSIQYYSPTNTSTLNSEHFLAFLPKFFKIFQLQLHDTCVICAITLDVVFLEAFGRYLDHVNKTGVR